MTTAETAIMMVLNSIENKHREQLEMIDALIFVACNDMKNEIDGVVFGIPKILSLLVITLKPCGTKYGAIVIILWVFLGKRKVIWILRCYTKSHV